MKNLTFTYFHAYFASYKIRSSFPLEWAKVYTKADLLLFTYTQVYSSFLFISFFAIFYEPSVYLIILLKCRRTEKIFTFTFYYQKKRKTNSGIMFTCVRVMMSSFFLYPHIWLYVEPKRYHLHPWVRLFKSIFGFPAYFSWLNAILAMLMRMQTKYLPQNGIVPECVVSIIIICVMLCIIS